MNRAAHFGATIVTVLCLVPGLALAEPDSTTPLKEAVAAFNDKATEYLAPLAEHKILPRDRWPAPLTADEVVAAIRGWTPGDEVDDRTRDIYQRIAETKSLPARADFEFRLQWRYEDGDYEHRVWSIMLIVMTGEKTGYGLRIRDEKLDRRRALWASPGHFWLVNPHTIPRPSPAGWSSGGAGWSSGGVVLSIDEDQEGALTVTAAWVAGRLKTREGDAIHELQFVAFDEQANRYVLAERSIGSVDDLVMWRFRLDPGKLAAGKVQHLGIEALGSDGLKLVSEAAVRRARERGIEILPLPQVGHRYEFALTATSGRLIDSKELRGKVVLIDCWASWCGPCLKKMPELKEIYEKWHAEGLEVVGLSWDDDAEAARTVFQRHEIPWPLVVVPGDDDTRQLWDEATRISSLPTVLLIDQHGVLRANLSGQPAEWALEDKIAAILQASSVPADHPR